MKHYFPSTILFFFPNLLFKKLSFKYTTEKGNLRNSEKQNYYEF